MRKSRIAKRKMFREFSVTKKKYLGDNHLKYLRKVKREFCDSNEVTPNQLDFLLWAYDLDFFTIDFASKDNDFNRRHCETKMIYPLVNTGMLQKVFDKLSPKNKEENLIFREETKFNFRVRYGITQRGKMVVQAFYRRLRESVG